MSSLTNVGFFPDSEVGNFLKNCAAEIQKDEASVGRISSLVNNYLSQNTTQLTDRQLGSLTLFRDVIYSYQNNGEGSSS